MPDMARWIYSEGLGPKLARAAIIATGSLATAGILGVLGVLGS